MTDSRQNELRGLQRVFVSDNEMYAHNVLDMLIFAYDSDHRGTGPLKTTMDVIDAAKVCLQLMCLKPKVHVKKRTNL